jgi:hypothetical protein
MKSPVPIHLESRDDIEAFRNRGCLMFERVAGGSEDRDEKDEKVEMGEWE